MGDHVVWKFAIPVTGVTAMFSNVFAIPRGARLLTVREQGMELAMWFEVEPEAEKEDRFFRIYGTGVSRVEGRYTGTGIFSGGSLVLHVYEVDS